MDLPRSCSDIRIATACPICNGNGGFGSRTREGGNPHQPCTTCEGIGWKFNFLPDIPAQLARKIRDKLTPRSLTSDLRPLLQSTSSGFTLLGQNPA